MKKKFVASSKDKKDWMLFTKQMGSISVKEADLVHKNTKVNKIPRLDLHGFSLEQANKTTKDFIIKSFTSGDNSYSISSEKEHCLKHMDFLISYSFDPVNGKVPQHIA